MKFVIVISFSHYFGFIHLILCLLENSDQNL
jgi:hypothetical protein